MRKTFPMDIESVSPALVQRLDEVCDRFESCWKAGARPRIEDYLSEVQEPGLWVLLRELVVVELQYRHWRGEPADLSEYQRRFPEYSQLLSVLFDTEAELIGPPRGENTSTDNSVDSSPHKDVSADEKPRDFVRLGRYRITGRIGSGSFGVVYQGHDDELRRDVAIKVPHRRHISSPEDIKTYLAEARILAGLDHPGIIPIHDVGRTEDGLCYLVTKLAAGSDLRRLIRDTRPSVAVAIEIVARVAEALHYAHQCGFVHRDIKPANILLDADGNPMLTDFGLALREEEFAQGPTFAGTPAYMSPEQARGEGHLVDVRTDVYGLGMVLYELLTGQRPYSAANEAELLEQIKTAEPLAPRQCIDTIPKEVERICLKTLAKRANDRYRTALEFAEDLRRWQLHKRDELAGKAGAPLGSGTDNLSSSGESSSKLVPKGLRPFDGEDADFFLELLPGPRDGNGLPDSIRFWKTRIEATDPEKTFRVGLLYGPSGCGKSSLVKAGLLPRLSDSVATIYVESSAAETEARLLRGLRRHGSNLPDQCRLVEAMAALRRSRGWPAKKKVLVVLDQFEQWLHGRGEEQHTELVEALRQCDGQHVQCLVLVRDDFGMAATRFMSDLEIPIVEGQNFATVDRFDLRHARSVLIQFGRAFSCLPAAPTALTPTQEKFLDQALAGLAQEGKIVCVHLILFVEMVKSRPWSPATLKQVGGIEGLGATFLEEMLGKNAVNPAHRRHQSATQAVLTALLPDHGSDIRGHIRSYHELLTASDLSPSAFDDLLYILETELRVIAPTDTEGRCYQLTHDYLVPALRQWLTVKQRETRGGRAHLLLAERASVWNAQPQKRHLPTWWEWTAIQLHSRRSGWTEPQRRMMRAAGWHRLSHAGVLALLLCLFGWAAVEGSRYLRAVELVRALGSVDTAGVAKIVGDLSSCRKWADPRLTTMIEEGDRKQRLHASLALLPVDPGQFNYLYDRMLDPDQQADVVWVICQALRDHRQELASRLSDFLEEESNRDRRLRAACALAFYDPRNLLWTRDTVLCDEVANKLLKEPPVVSEIWLQGTRALRRQFGKSFLNIVADTTRSESERTMAAHLSLLCKPIEVTTEEMAAFILDTDDLLLYDRVLPYFLAKSGEATSLMREELQKKTQLEMSEVQKNLLPQRQAKAAVFLLQYDQQESPWPVQQAACLWPLLRDCSNPALRACLIHRFSEAGADPQTLIRQYEVEQDVGARQALLLSVGGFRETLPVRQREQLVTRLKLLETYRVDPDPGVHAAVDWLLRGWGLGAELDKIDRQMAGMRTDFPLDSQGRDSPGSERSEQPQRSWYVNGQGQTMIVLPGPVEFLMGSPVEETGRHADETLHRRRIPRSFAVAAKEVTVRQFKTFLDACPGIQHDWAATDPSSADPDEPIVSLTWFEAAQYCRWLSEQEGIPEDQMCYPPIDQIRSAMRMSPDYLARTGYRLPTEAEWEYSCRAGSTMSRYYGVLDQLLGNYARYVQNADGRPGPVGRKQPNDYGLFDLYGNASELCQDAAGPYPSTDGEQPVGDGEDDRLINTSQNRVLRGGSFASPPLDLRSARRFELEATAPRSFVGLRVARTLGGMD